MSDTVRPFTAFLEPGMTVLAAFVDDGGRETQEGDGRVGGYVLAVVDDPDPDTGEVRRAFRVLDFRTSKRRGPVFRVLAEAELDRDTVDTPDSAALRRMRRVLHQWIGDRLVTPTGKFRNPPADTGEYEAEKAIAVLLRAELS
jgi:hypothetical protein